MRVCVCMCVSPSERVSVNAQQLGDKKDGGYYLLEGRTQRKKCSET